MRHSPSALALALASTPAVCAAPVLARGLTGMLGNVLVKTGRFVVLERAAMMQIDQKQALAAAGKTTKETGAKTGAILRAQLMITGDITGFVEAKSSIGGKMANVRKGLTVSSERVTAEVIIDLRFNVLEKFSAAKVTVGDGIERGHVLRFRAP